MQPGYKTSEWWLALAAMVIGTLIVSGLIGETSALGKTLAFASSVLASIGYSYSRGMAKSAPGGASPPSPPASSTTPIPPS